MPFCVNRLKNDIGYKNLSRKKAGNIEFTRIINTKVILIMRVKKFYRIIFSIFFIKTLLISGNGQESEKAEGGEGRVPVILLPILEGYWLKCKFYILLFLFPHSCQASINEYIWFCCSSRCF